MVKLFFVNVVKVQESFIMEKEGPGNTATGADRGLLQSRERNVIININKLKTVKTNNENLSESITKSIETQNSIITNTTTKHTKKDTQGSERKSSTDTTIEDVTIEYRDAKERRGRRDCDQKDKHSCGGISRAIIKTSGRSTISGALGTSAGNLHETVLTDLIGNERRKLLRMNVLGWG